MSCANLTSGQTLVAQPLVSQKANRGQATLNGTTNVSVSIPYLASTDVIIIQPIGVANAGFIGATVSNSGLINASVAFVSSSATDVRVINYAVIKVS